MECKETGNSIILCTKDSSKIWEENDIREEIVVNWHDTIVFNKKEYHDVVQIHTGDTWENSAFIIHAYYVENIGAVYRKFGDGSEWELIRYKIGPQSAREYTKRQY